MKRQILFIIFIFVPLFAFCQKPVVEAIYYDEHNEPYKFEQKYIHEQTTTYIRHDNEKSICLKREKTISADTTIISETYFNIIREKTKLEKLLDCNSWVEATNEAGDTVTLTGFSSYLSDTIDYSLDTTLTGEAAKNSMYFSEQIKNARVPQILANKINVSIDSLSPSESTRSYYIHEIPVKVEVFDWKQIPHSIGLGVIVGNNLIWNERFINEKNPFQIDTMTWNKDTTFITYHLTRFDLNINNYIVYKINGTRLDVAFSDSTKRQIEYLPGENIFRNILDRAFIYFDELYYMELRFLDIERIRIESKQGVTKNLYTYDKQNRIIMQKSYYNEKLKKRVLYTFPSH